MPLCFYIYVFLCTLEIVICAKKINVFILNSTTTTYNFCEPRNKKDLRRKIRQRWLGCRIKLKTAMDRKLGGLVCSDKGQGGGHSLFSCDPQIEIN